MPRLHRAPLREVASFSGTATLTALVWSLFRSIDYAILGVRIGAREVGYYQRAFQLAVDYQGKLSTVLLRVGFPLYSRAPTRSALQEIRARVVRVHATMLLPGLAAFIAVAPVMIPLLYGERWSPAVVPAQILAIYGMITVLLTGIGPLLLAAGKSQALLVWNVFSLGIYAGAVYAAAPFGLKVVCASVVAVGFVDFALALVVTNRLLEIPWRSAWEDAGPGLVTSIAITVFVGGLVRLFIAAGIDSTVTLVFGTITSIVVAIGVLRQYFSGTWRDVTRVLAQLRQPNARSAAPGMVEKSVV